jgi:hypothetical protein
VQSTLDLSASVSLSRPALSTYLFVPSAGGSVASLSPVLRTYDAHSGTDREIAAAAARIRSEPLATERFTRDREAAERLRPIMCPEYSGEIRRVGGESELLFVYMCRDRHGALVAMGEGDTEALAICDAFLRFALRRK